MKTKNKRCRDPRVKCWVYIIAKGAKYNRKHNILNNFPPNKDNNKSQAVFLKKSLQVLFGEIVKFIRYSSFEPIDHKFFGGGARSRTVVLRLPLQDLISVEFPNHPHLVVDNQE